MSDLLSWLAKYSQDDSNPRNENIIIAPTGESTEFCFHVPDARPECPLCKCVFANSNTLIEHLLLTQTRLNMDYEIGKHDSNSTEPTQSPTSPLQTVDEANGRSTLTPHMSNMWLSPQSYNWISTPSGWCHYNNVKTELPEAENIKTEPNFEWITSNNTGSFVNSFE